MYASRHNMRGSFSNCFGLSDETQALRLCRRPFCCVIVKMVRNINKTVLENDNDVEERRESERDEEKDA